MTKATRRTRRDSVSEVSRIMQGAKMEIAPPSHVPLQEMDWPFWESVVAEFARADWTEHQLELAAMLARCLADLEENQRMLRAEGLTIVREIKNGAGEIIKCISYENARARSVATLMTQVLAMRRSLALHAKAKSGSNADAAAQRQANKDVERKGKAGEDDLLA